MQKKKIPPSSEAIFAKIQTAIEGECNGMHGDFCRQRHAIGTETLINEDKLFTSYSRIVNTAVQSSLLYVQCI